MVASNNTIAETLKVVRRHVNDTTLERILSDLLEVRGNAPFEETVQRMHADFASARINHRKRKHD